MENIIEIYVTEVGKNSTRDSGVAFSQYKKQFKNMEEFHAWRKQTYGNKRAKPMFRDRNGKAVKVGYIYSYWNYDVSHPKYTKKGGYKKWLQEDWIEVVIVNHSFPKLR